MNAAPAKLALGCGVFPLPCYTSLVESPANLAPLLPQLRSAERRAREVEERAAQSAEAGRSAQAAAERAQQAQCALQEQLDSTAQQAQQLEDSLAHTQAQLAAAREEAQKERRLREEGEAEMQARLRLWWVAVVNSKHAHWGSRAQVAQHDKHCPSDLQMHRSLMNAWPWKRAFCACQLPACTFDPRAF